MRRAAAAFWSAKQAKKRGIVTAAEKVRPTSATAGAAQANGLCRSGCRKSPMDFFDSLHNASLFCPRSGPKSCRCAAQTPADTGFLQAFNPTRGGSRPLVLPLQKRTLFLQTGFFDKLRKAEIRLPVFFKNGDRIKPYRFLPFLCIKAKFSQYT